MVSFSLLVAEQDKTYKTCGLLYYQGKSPNKDDWGKLKGVLKYLNGPKEPAIYINSEVIRVMI